MNPFGNDELSIKIQIKPFDAEPTALWTGKPMGAPLGNPA